MCAGASSSWRTCLWSLKQDTDCDGSIDKEYYPIKLCPNNNFCRNTYGANYYCDGGHCCLNGEYWNAGTQKCIEGALCDYLWGTTSQRPIDAWHPTYWLNSGLIPDDRCCCHFTQYNLLDDWWSAITIY